MTPECLQTRTDTRVFKPGSLTMHKCAYTRLMAGDVEWDPRKAAANLKKHRVDFADAATVLHDEQAITIRDDEADEERYVTIGMTPSEMCSLSSTRGAATGRV